MRSQKPGGYEGGDSREKKARRGRELGLGQGLGRWPACRTGVWAPRSRIWRQGGLSELGGSLESGEAGAEPGIPLPLTSYNSQTTIAVITPKVLIGNAIQCMKNGTALWKLGSLL